MLGLAHEEAALIEENQKLREQIEEETSVDGLFSLPSARSS